MPCENVQGTEGLQRGVRAPQAFFPLPVGSEPLDLTSEGPTLWFWHWEASQFSWDHLSAPWEAEGTAEGLG